MWASRERTVSSLRRLIAATTQTPPDSPEYVYCTLTPKIHLSFTLPVFPPSIFPEQIMKQNIRYLSHSFMLSQTKTSWTFVYRVMQAVAPAIVYLFTFIVKLTAIQTNVILSSATVWAWGYIWRFRQMSCNCVTLLSRCYSEHRWLGPDLSPEVLCWQVVRFGGE